MAAFTSGVQTVGLREGDDFEMLPRLGAGEDTGRLASQAADLVARNVDVISAISPAPIRAAMAAAVVQRTDAAVVMAQHDDRLLRHASGDEVAGLGQLALMADIDPGAREDARHLAREDRRVGVDPAMHRVGPDERLRRVRRHHQRSKRRAARSTSAGGRVMPTAAADAVLM